jgi:redox-sensitive bicupin YhaK (pirin superfamily)
MSAVRGVLHSEFNHGESAVVRERGEQAEVLLFDLS